MSGTTARARGGRSERGLCPRNLGGRPRRGAEPPAEGKKVKRRNLERRYAELIESLYRER